MIMDKQLIELGPKLRILLMVFVFVYLGIGGTMIIVHNFILPREIPPKIPFEYLFPYAFTCLALFRPPKLGTFKTLLVVALALPLLGLVLSEVISAIPGSFPEPTLIRKAVTILIFSWAFAGVIFGLSFLCKQLGYDVWGS